jgi:hypothetical protein
MCQYLLIVPICYPPFVVDIIDFLLFKNVNLVAFCQNRVSLPYVVCDTVSLGKEFCLECCCKIFLNSWRPYDARPVLQHWNLFCHGNIFFRL